jgi:hypothetical protein
MNCNSKNYWGRLNEICQVPLASLVYPHPFFQDGFCRCSSELAVRGFPLLSAQAQVSAAESGGENAKINRKYKSSQGSPDYLIVTKKA